MKYLLLLTFIIHSALPQDRESCDNLFNWIYRDTTLSNMQGTMEVIRAKTMLAVLISLKNSKNQRLSQNQELIKHYKTLSENSEEFVRLTEDYSPLSSYRFWRPIGYYFTDTLNFESAIESWKTLQQNRPDLFKGLDNKYKLNDWDLNIIHKINKASNFQISDKDLAKTLSSLLKKIKSKKAYDIDDSDIDKLKLQINRRQNRILKDIKNNYQNYLSQFKDLCNGDYRYGLEINKCNQALSNNKIEDQLNSFSDIFNKVQIYNAKEPKAVNPLAGLIIRKQKYKTNKNPKATYCIRDKKALSNITIHHTGTSSKWTPQDINRFHLNRSTKGDPWYMVGYHYLISSATTTISEARPIEYRGAHAGGYEKRLSNKEYDRIKDLKMTCAHSKSQHESKTPVSISQDFKSYRRPHGNLTSIGVAVIGNYETDYKSDVSGVTLIRNDAKIQRLSKKVITKLSKLVCKLQKDNPTVKTIRPHSYYKKTNCPGSIIADLKEIKKLAKSYGCSFDVEFSK